MHTSTIAPFNLAHQAGPLRWARFADADGAPTGGAPADGAAQDAKTPGPTPPAGDTGKPAAGLASQDDKGKGDALPDDPEKLKEMIHKLNGENAKARTDAKTRAADQAKTDLVQQLGKALGLIKDDDPKQTVEDLTAQLTAQQETAKAAQTKLAVYRAAGTVADPDMLLDSTSFLASIKDVDVTDTKAVQDAVKAFVTEHPKFAPTQVAGASTVEHPGGSGENTGHPTSLEAAITNAYSK